jgi:thymidylate synthase (FAD)
MPNIVKPYAKILYPDHYGAGEDDKRDYGIFLLRNIEYYARVSHRSEDAVTPGSYDRFIRAVVIQHGDWSVVEHEKITVEAVVDRGITHEIVRHRLFSFTQESTRFVNYEKKIPPSFIEPSGLTQAARADWEFGMGQTEAIYRSLLATGATPQIARSVFPNALASKIIITGNLRNWRHFFIMRTTKEAHPQMKEITIPLLEEFKETIPILYEDIEPNARQIDNLKLPR